MRKNGMYGIILCSMCVWLCVRVFAKQRDKMMISKIDSSPPVEPHFINKVDFNTSESFFFTQKKPKKNAKPYQR